MIFCLFLISFDVFPRGILAFFWSSPPVLLPTSTSSFLPPSTMRIAVPVTAPVLVIVILLSVIRGCESSDDGESFFYRESRFAWRMNFDSNLGQWTMPTLIRPSSSFSTTAAHFFSFSREICHLWIGHQAHTRGIGWKLLSP